MQIRKYVIWLASSLIGTIVLFQFGFAVPMFIIFSYLNYTEGTLTPAWALYSALICCLAGASVGVFVWNTIFSSVSKRQKRKLRISVCDFEIARTDSKSFAQLADKLEPLHTEFIIRPIARVSFVPRLASVFILAGLETTALALSRKLVRVLSQFEPFRPRLLT